MTDHTEENRKVFEFNLSDKDQEDINSVLVRSRSRDMIQTIGDCGAEYR